jgi:hypothetical protein
VKRLLLPLTDILLTIVNKYFKAETEMKQFTILLFALVLAGGFCSNVFPQHSLAMSTLDRSCQDTQKLPATKPAAPNIWTIGIYTGTSPFQLSSPENIKNPVLTAAVVNDLKVDIVAHPFLVVTDSMHYMFFTAKDGKTDKGGIGLAESKDGFNWKYRQIVLLEPFVLSYPCVFKWKNDYYMIPEAHTETSLRLYKATEFPVKWEYERDLLTGDTFISSTILRYKNMWWLFVARSGNETLRLFYASDLKGKWTEHPMSPVVKKDLNTARPAGRPFVVNGTLYRLGQDCDPTYGNQVHAFQITEITTRTYAEKMIDTPLVKSTSKGWNSEAMHHIDAFRTGRKEWIAVVDALGNNP